MNAPGSSDLPAKQDAFELPPFPTMLRKMWSGGEVQQWIDANLKPLFCMAGEPVAWISIDEAEEAIPGSGTKMIGFTPVVGAYKNIPLGPIQPPSTPQQVADSRGAAPALR